MKSTIESKTKKERSYQETINYLNSKLKKYEVSHGKFVVPWQMEESKKEQFHY
jgi:hypothetical protein